MDLTATSDGSIARAIGYDVTPDWTGRPPSGLMLRPSDLGLIPFSLLWCGFVIFWESAAMHASAPFLRLWGIPFVAFGLYFVIGRFFVDAYFRARTRYAIASGRAYVVRTGALSKTVVYALTSAAGPIEVERRADGSGNIWFGPRVQSWNGSFSMWNVGSTRGFERIADVDAVYRIVARAQERTT